MLNELKKGRKVVGIKQLRKALKEDRIACAFFAEDAAPDLTAPLCAECTRLDVRQVSVPTMVELGKICGISVGAAAAGLLR